MSVSRDAAGGARRSGMLAIMNAWLADHWYISGRVTLKVATCALLKLLGCKHPVLETKLVGARLRAA